MIQNFHLNDQIVTTLGGARQTITGGPVASQEAIKVLSGDGGGFYNAQSAHPFENPTAWTNWAETFLMLVIGFTLPRTFGRIVGNKKQGYAIAAVMGVIAVISVGLMMLVQLQHHGTVPTAAGAAMEGVEQRFGVSSSAVFADAGTLTSDGAVDSMHDSYTSLGGFMAMFNMQLGEVAPGGPGSGLYGMLILAVVTVFIAGLMVGRTPEYLGKKITPREMKLATVYFLTTEVLVLLGTGVAMAFPAPTRRHGQQRTARPFRGAVRVHFRGQHQWLGFRGSVGEHDVVQHRSRSGDADRQILADDPGARSGRLAGPSGSYAGVARHPTHPPAAVRRPSRGGDGHPVWPHLLTSLGTRAARRRNPLTDAMDQGRVAGLDRDMLQQGTCAVTAQGRPESAGPTGWDRAVVP